MQKHILVISQYFYPEQFRINDICCEWIKRGYKVTVVTGIPNYPQGKFYEGYDYTHKRFEEWNGIKIIRMAIKPRKTGSVNLIKNYFSFVYQGNKWVRKHDLKADVVFVYEVSPMTQALVGVKYSKKHHVGCNLYVTDLWPENVELITGIHNKLFLAPIGWMVDYVYKHCNWIFTSSKSFVNKIASRGVSKDKLVYWPQYAEDFYSKVESSEVTEIPNDGNTNITFAGNIGYAQGLQVLIGSAKLLQKKKTKVRFNIIGNGRYLDEMKLLVLQENLSTIFNFIDRQPAEKIPYFFAASDAALITLEKSEVFAMTIPSKTQSCMACGMPIIASVDGEVQTIINDAKCGFASDAGDEKALAKNIERFCGLSDDEKENMAERSLEYYKNNFERKMLLDKMEEFINE